MDCWGLFAGSQNVALMRRVVSYGGPYGVPASQRLKHKLSSTHGLHLISSNLSEEGEFLASVQELQVERIIHKTSWATRNFFATVFALKKPSKRESCSNQKDLFVPLLKERTIFDDPVEADKYNDGPSLITGAKDAVLLNGGAQVSHGTRHIDAGSPPEVPSSLPCSISIQEPEGTVVDADLSSSSSSCHVTHAATSIVSASRNDLCQDLVESALVSKVQKHDTIAQCSLVGIDLHLSDTLCAEGSGWGGPEPLDLSLKSYCHQQCELGQLEKTSRVVAGYLQGAGQLSEAYSFSGAVKLADVCLLPNSTSQDTGTFQQVTCGTVIVGNVDIGSSDIPCLLGHGDVFCNSIEDPVSYQCKNSAALKIQSFCRGWLQRRYFMEVRGKVVILQSFVRRKRDLMQYQRVLRAAIVLQKNWRAFKRKIFCKYLKMEQVVREQERMDYAATVLQKYWRSFQSRRLLKYLKKEHTVGEQQKVDSAALVLQKHWRSLQSRCWLKHLRAQQTVMYKQRVETAAIVLQKHWRSVQCRLLVKQLKLRQVAWEQDRVYNAATVVQSYWRAVQSRCLAKKLKMQQAARELQMKYLKMEQAVRELQTVERAAIVLQKYWRALQGRHVAKLLKIKQSVLAQQEVSKTTCAAIHIQARVRGNACTAELKSRDSPALIIQTRWCQYQSTRCTSPGCIHQNSHSSPDQQRRIQAAVVLQAYARGIAVRHRLSLMPISAYITQQPSHICKKGLIAVAMPQNPDIEVLSESNTHIPDTSALMIQHDVQTSDEILNSLEGVGRLDYDVISSIQEGDTCLSSGLGDEFSARDLNTQKNGEHEDWNHVAVDHLDECFDTCLPVIRSLPPTLCASSVAQQCLPKFDVSNAAQQFCTTDQSIYSDSGENSKVTKNVPSVPTTSLITLPHMTRAVKEVDSSEKDFSVATWNAPDMCTVQLDQCPLSACDNSQLAELSAALHVESPADAQQNPDTHQGTHKENLAQGKSRRSQSLKHDEKRLQQFAQVFLLQRHIALQQQRAQAAPPFPPPMPSHSRSPSLLATQSLDLETGDFGFNGGRSLAVHNPDANPSWVTGPVEHDLFHETLNPGNRPLLSKQGLGIQNCSTSSKQAIETQGTDVVLDMVLLLRQIREEYGTTEVELEGESSVCFPSGYGDIEEGVSLLGRNAGPIRKQNSILSCSSGLSIKRIGIPDVNALFLVLIAMVVYTRTICQGVLFGTRQTHRRPQN